MLSGTLHFPSGTTRVSECYLTQDRPWGICRNSLSRYKLQQSVKGTWRRIHVSFLDSHPFFPQLSISVEPLMDSRGVLMGLQMDR